MERTDSQTVRWVVVPAIGGMIGAWLAYYFFPLPIWPFGLLGGAVVAGFIWSFRDIVRYAPRAAKAAWSALVYIPRIVGLPAAAWKAWRDMPRVRKWRWGARGMVSVGWLAWLVALVLLWVGENRPLPRDTVTGVGMVLTSELWLVFTSYYVVVKAYGKLPPGEEDRAIRKAQGAILIASPVGPIAIIVLPGIMGIRLLVRSLPAILKAGQEAPMFFWVFGKTLFLLIHSRELVVVMFLALIGGGFGLWVGLLKDSLPIALVFGALGGSVAGFLYYRFVYMPLRRLA